MKNIYLKSRNKGQVMLLTAMAVSAMVIAATSLAGLLTLYELNQVTDVKDSGEAIFAADAGTECLSYQNFVNNSVDCNNGGLDNGAKFTTTSTGSKIFTSVGIAGRSTRAFQINFNNISTSTGQ